LNMGKLKSCGFLIFRDTPNSEPENASPVQSNSHLPSASGQVSFLLLKHPTRWDLPKGHVDPGETNMECALRELEEETGIQAQDLIIDPDFKYKQKYMITSKRTDNKPKKKKLIIYMAKLIRPTQSLLRPKSTTKSLSHKLFERLILLLCHEILGQALVKHLAQQVSDVARLRANGQHSQTLTRHGNNHLLASWLFSNERPAGETKKTYLT